MTGTDYERAVGDYLFRNGCNHVRVTQQSGDYGVDVVAEINGIKCAFQCKETKKPVTQKAVREVAAGMAHYGARQGFVITNSTFSPAARELAEDNGVVLCEGFDADSMETYDFDKNIKGYFGEPADTFKYELLDGRLKSFGDKRIYELADDLLIMDGVKYFEPMLINHGIDPAEKKFVLQCLKKARIIPVAHEMRTHSLDNDYYDWISYKARQKNWTKEETEEYVKSVFRRNRNALDDNGCVPWFEK